MKHFNKLTLLAALSGVLLLSNCKDKDKEEGDIISEDFKTPEQNKAAIQDIAVEFVNEMSLLEESKSAQAAANMLLKLDLGEDDEEIIWEEASIPQGARIAIRQINQSAVAFSKGKISGKGFATAAIGEDGDDDDEFESFQEFFNENKGVYEWNEDTEEFDEPTTGGSVITLKFPSDDSETTNNASFTIRSYKGVVIEGNPLEEDYTGELPESLVADLFIDGVKEMEYTITAAYNSAGEPTQLNTKLFMNPFTLSASLTNTTSKVASSVNLSRDSKVIIGSSVELVGNFSEDNINAAEEEEKIGDVLTDAKMTFTLLNLKIEGSAMVDDLEDATKNLVTEYYSYDDDASVKTQVETDAPKLAIALNAHTTMKMKYADSGVKAADMEWYTTIEEYSYSDYEELWAEPGIRMVFADGSKVDFVDFVETGMDELESAINAFLAQFGETVGEEFDPIEFDEEDED